MKGAHRVIVESRKIKYDFVIRRNLTILTGDSGSGKTVLIDLIREHRRYGTDSGVSVSCDRECRTLDHEDWARQLEEISGKESIDPKFVITEDSNSGYEFFKELSDLTLISHPSLNSLRILLTAKNMSAGKDFLQCC